MNLKKNQTFALLYQLERPTRSIKRLSQGKEGKSRGHFRIITKMVSPETETQKARFTSGRSCPVANSRRANNCGKQMGKDLRRIFPKPMPMVPSKLPT